jgi:hypothetical protein
MSSPAAFSLGRIGAMVLRYTYLLRSSWPRMLEMTYWPAVQMLTWGFLQTYLVRAQGIAPNGAAIAAGALIGAVLLRDILLRGQQGFSFSFLEEMWSRNIANLLMSPLRPAEFVIALMVMSLIRPMGQEHWQSRHRAHTDCGAAHRCHHGDIGACPDRGGHRNGARQWRPADCCKFGSANAKGQKPA